MRITLKFIIFPALPLSFHTENSFFKSSIFAITRCDRKKKPLVIRNANNRIFTPRLDARTNFNLGEIVPSQGVT